MNIPDTIVGWQCIGCGRVDAPQPCIGVCQDRKVELIAAGDYLQLWERHEAALALLCDPTLCERIVADVATLGVVGEDRNALVGYLACVSRKLAAPLAVLIQSTSAAGKSTLMEALLSLMARLGSSQPVELKMSLDDLAADGQTQPRACALPPGFAGVEGLENGGRGNFCLLVTISRFELLEQLLHFGVILFQHLDNARRKCGFPCHDNLLMVFHRCELSQQPIKRIP